MADPKAAKSSRSLLSVPGVRIKRLENNVPGLAGAFALPDTNTLWSLFNDPEVKGWATNYITSASRT